MYVYTCCGQQLLLCILLLVRLPELCFFTSSLGPIDNFAFPFFPNIQLFAMSCPNNFGNILRLTLFLPHDSTLEPSNAVITICMKSVILLCSGSTCRILSLYSSCHFQDGKHLIGPRVLAGCVVKWMIDTNTHSDRIKNQLQDLEKSDFGLCLCTSG